MCVTTGAAAALAAVFTVHAPLLNPQAMPTMAQLLNMNALSQLGSAALAAPVGAAPVPRKAAVAKVD